MMGELTILYMFVCVCVCVCVLFMYARHALFNHN